MLNRFIWKYFVRHLARSQGFVDPVLLMSRLGSFSQPSEIAFPMELIRGTAMLHVRGLLNAQAIQHNLDWVWPYWVQKQFDPLSNSFIPRAFSLTHINLTHRNWTAVGLPDMEETPLVDPRGLVTPLWDGWSIDAWVIDPNGRKIIPSRMKEVKQKVVYSNNFQIVTSCVDRDLCMTSTVEMIRTGATVLCRILVEAQGGSKDCQLVISLRPYNPEGVSLVKSISIDEDGLGWTINQKEKVHFSAQPWKHVLSNYRKGDVYAHLNERNDDHKSIVCSVEMASAAAIFPMDPMKTIILAIDIPLRQIPVSPGKILVPQPQWNESLEGMCAISIPEERYQYLFEVAQRTLLIHTSHDVYAGPFVHKRVWFRDAVYITYTLLCCGFHDRAERIIDQFHRRQKMNGLFESQEGEWDSSGQVLWIIEQYCQMTGRPLKAEWQLMITRGANWIVKKRLKDKENGELHAGLMPSGFSAEHFGPNDYYYWDDFWSVAGLRAASSLAQTFKDKESSELFKKQANELLACVEKSLVCVCEPMKNPAMPSSPYRRLDSASVGSLVSGYPLNLWKEKDPRLTATTEFLMKNCIVQNGFFHDMSHSGINPYLTLHIAQVLLRARDPRYLCLMNGIAALASPTGQWPEAIHPQTGGGCMGDGQHVWAAAEWIMMVRNCFVREEEDKLILCSGLPEAWFKKEANLSFGPVWTKFGKIQLKIISDNENITIMWEAKWHHRKPSIEVHFLDHDIIHAEDSKQSVMIPWISNSLQSSRHTLN